MQHFDRQLLQLLQRSMKGLSKVEVCCLLISFLSLAKASNVAAGRSRGSERI